MRHKRAGVALLSIQHTLLLLVGSGLSNEYFQL